MTERLNETQKYYNILVKREQKILDTLESVSKLKESNKVYEAMHEIQVQELYITRLAKDHLEDLVNAEYGGQMMDIMKKGASMVKENNRRNKAIDDYLKG